MMDKKQRCQETIRQFRAGEWTFDWHPDINRSLTAERNGVEIWCATPFFTNVIGARNFFGRIGRLVVFFRGIWPAKVAFERSRRREARRKVEDKIFNQDKEQAHGKN